MVPIKGRIRHGGTFLLAAAFFVLLPPVPAAAEEAADKPVGFDPIPFIGMEPAVAFGTLGAPLEIFPFERAVVFYYPDHKYLFWFQNRVWQVRVDRRYENAAMGFRMGEPKAEATARIGRLFKDLGDSVTFHVGTAGVPLEVRLVFEDGKLSDFYAYRSDW